MKIQGLKNLNITLLFSTPLNHLLISQGEVVELFKTGDMQKDLFSTIEAPGFKAVIFQNQKKDIAFENSRVSLSDKSEVEISQSVIVSDLRKILDSKLFVDQSKIIAYGFNYDFLAELDNGNDLIGKKISELPNITVKNPGVNFSFEKNGATSILSISPTGKEKLFLVHLNSNFNSVVVPADKVLNEQIITQFKNLEEILNNL